MEQIENECDWIAMMLNKVTKDPLKRNSFEVWWRALPKDIREKQDYAFAKRCFRAGHLLGARPAKTKFRFRAGRLSSGPERQTANTLRGKP
ncbi:hypothetical protein BN77_2795 [Rhizobium mesoamericanum STM3625]|uniref:Uncharacterized protein n=1 Tax=Rhizobium mesoamericanum STM3625 TaxID=1211777 RepID=K0PGL6_9HYPH|nr:hypothetical protein BN77_2795 [Rhizobium mesoamericanum STM3625]